MLRNVYRVNRKSVYTFLEVDISGMQDRTKQMLVPIDRKSVLTYSNDQELTKYLETLDRRGGTIRGSGKGRAPLLWQETYHHAVISGRIALKLPGKDPQ